MLKKNIIHSIQNTVEHLLDVVLPAQCISCFRYLETNRTLCKTCLHSIQVETGLFCPVCNKRIATLHACHPSPLTALGFCTSYASPLIRDLIHTYKYNSATSCANDIVELCNAYLNNIKHILNLRDYQKASLLIPIPLHPLRERTRGFNQSELLAQCLSTHYNIPTLQPLVRTRNNKPQAQMKTMEHRIQNAEHLFKLLSPHADTLRNKTLFLIDDVTTSCATLFSAAEELRRAKPKRIIGFVFAKG